MEYLVFLAIFALGFFGGAVVVSYTIQKIGKNLAQIVDDNYVRVFTEVDSQRYFLNRVEGLLTKLTIEAKVSKEIASRAFNMASSSQVCAATLQTAIARKPRGYQAEVKESVASKKISEELGGEDINDFLYAVMTEEERQKIDKTRKYFNAGI